MVMYRLKDGNGNPIKPERIESSKKYGDELIDIIIDSSETFSSGELLLILNLIEKRVEYGGDVPTTKQYLDLYDKIEKIVYQNDCK